MNLILPVTTRFNPRFPAVILLGLMALVLVSCGKPFNVKPKPTVQDIKPAANLTLKAKDVINGLTIQAEAITDEDFIYDTFDANLIMANVLPVRLQLINGNAGKVNLHKARFEILAQNRIYKMIDSHKAYKKLMSYYGIKIYNKHGYKESREDFDSHAADLKKEMASGETREGLIYFSIPQEIIKSSGMKLLARKFSVGQSKDDLRVELLLR